MLKITKTCLVLFGLFLFAGLARAQQPVAIRGNIGGVFDAVQGAAAPANALVVGGVYNSTLPTISTGDTSQFQIDAAGQMLVDLNYVGGVALGATVNYGSTPSAVKALSANVFVTNAGSIGTPTPSTSSTYAFSIYHNTSAAAGSIKASAGNLYALSVGNGGTIACYLQLFNTAGTPTAGTSVIDSYMVQAGTSRDIPLATLARENFATGIGYAGATTDSGATTTGCTTTMDLTAVFF